MTDAPEIRLWKCPNCGQVHFGDVPPDMCDFCRDFTTWQPHEDFSTDPLLGFALELGAELYMIGDDGASRRRLHLSYERDERGHGRQLSLFDD
jgi:hypothetical protein